MTPTYLVSEPATPDDFVIALIHPVIDHTKRKSVRQVSTPGTAVPGAVAARDASRSGIITWGATLMRYCRVAEVVLQVETHFESDPYHVDQLERSGKYSKSSTYAMNKL